jgi:hypothetical protein
MSVLAAIELKCEDYLQDNSHLYAYKARRKKIAIVRVEIATAGAADAVRIDLGTAQLIVAGRSYRVEPPERIIRRFTEFTWDFLLYLVVDFHPLLSMVDLAALVSGPVYNRRLKNQLRLLTNGEIVLRPGERKNVLLAFQDVTAEGARLQVTYRFGRGDLQRAECDLR